MEDKIKEKLEDIRTMLQNDGGDFVLLAPGVYPPIDGISEAEGLPLRSMTDEETAALTDCMARFKGLAPILGSE